LINKIVKSLAILLLISSCVSSTQIALLFHRPTGLAFVEVEINDQHGRFLLDTGTSYPVVSEEFVNRNHLEAIGELTGRTGEYVFVEPESFSIGDAKFTRTGRLLVKDLAGVSESMGIGIDGIVGSSLLNGAPYKIDFANRTLELGSQDDPVESGYKVVFKNQCPYVEVLLDGEIVEFLIDSGSIQSFVSQDTAEKFRESGNFSSSAGYNHITIDGSIRKEMQLIHINSLEFAGRDYHDISMFVEGENKIGLDILSNGTLIMNKKRGIYWFFEFGRSESQL